MSRFVTIHECHDLLGLSSCRCIPIAIAYLNNEKEELFRIQNEDRLHRQDIFHLEVKNISISTKSQPDFFFLLQNTNISELRHDI